MRPLRGRTPLTSPSGEIGRCASPGPTWSPSLPGWSGAGPLQSCRAFGTAAGVPTRSPHATAPRPHSPNQPWWLDWALRFPGFVVVAVSAGLEWGGAAAMLS
ncbi:hypothetical protein GCM10027610_141870 [Dactylosporangium cerinum]